MSIIPGFFENIEDDFEYISRRVRNTAMPLPHLNRNNRNENYREVYSKRMIDIVGEVYRVDIETFGYSFDNSKISHQLKLRNEGRLFAT